MNITQRMYFGQSPLDKDRDRRIAFTGVFPLSMKHRSMHSEIRCSGTTISFGIIPTGRS